MDNLDVILHELSGPIKKCRFKRLNELEETKDFVDTGLVQVLLKIENVPSTIADYRERERFLEEVLRFFRKKTLNNLDNAYNVTFQYLIGSLYVNFEKFWGPTVRVIIDLLNESGSYRKVLLASLVKLLKNTNDIIYSQTLKVTTVSSIRDDDRPDHVLHRNFIFQIMARFADYYQIESVSFMSEFFRFIEKEFLVSPFLEKHNREDLIKTTSSYQHDEDDVLDMEIDGQKKSKHGKKAKHVTQEFIAKRKSRETFLTASKVIQAFKNMKMVHRHVELKELLLDLLCSRDESVQKASFNCILVYDINGLSLYVPKIIKILNDKSTRSELSTFSIDVEESDQVLPEHRAELMPILLRILFGKMKGQIGKKSSGRDKADLRKTLVMRFIAGCSNEEISFFFELLFDPIHRFVDTPYEELDSVLKKDCDVRSYPPLNKMHAMLASLTAFMSSVAHQREESLENIFKLINIINHLVVQPLERLDIATSIKNDAVKSLKVLRRGCLGAMTEFFRMFEYYNFKNSEIQFMFKHMVWTSTKQFVDRNYDSETPLLRFIRVLASTSRYHKLLIKRNHANREEYLIRLVMDLYYSEKTSRPILKSVAALLCSIIDPDMEITDNFEEENVDVKLEMLDDADAVVPEFDSSSLRIDSDLPFNHRIVLTFIPVILERLNRNCKEFLDNRKSGYQLELYELRILSKLSHYLKNSDQCLLGARLLLSTLEKLKKESLILSTLTTSQSLLKQIDKNTDPLIIPLICNILSYQRNIDQRNELCNLLELLSLKDTNLKDAVSAIKLMNSTYGDMNSPDFSKWNEGFKMSFNYIDHLDQDRINDIDRSRDSIIILVHQVLFIIKNLDQYEFSTKENCLIFFEKLSVKLNLLDRSTNERMIKSLIDEILLDKFIRKGIRDTNNTIKHCYIGILRSLAIECHEKSHVLSDLYKFCDRNKDLDFWCNISHIQLHQRSRALARLIASDKLETISSKTLSSYFMPIAAGFLFSKAYKSVASLSDNSIKLIGIICRRTNWLTYESTLNYYLDLLTTANTTYQRQNIKVLSEIIKNFNFDLTSCEEAMQFEEENRKLAIRMRKRIGATESSSNVISASAPSGRKLNRSTARMVYHSVTKKIIPNLNSCLHEMTRVEFEADKNMSNYMPEKDQIKRISIAYAIVQLLNLLPGRYVLLRDHLPPLFLKLSTFLKSKNEPTRKTTRSILIKIMSFVGPAYFCDFLRILKQNLDKGFHVHVLNYTINSVLGALNLKYGDLDQSVSQLTDSCYQEIFGKFSEDKEVAKILAKTFEAKKTKGYDTLMILGSCISAEKLEELMAWIKGLLLKSNNSKEVNKLDVCIQKIFIGLSKNEFFPLDKILLFIKQRILEAIPSMKVRHRPAPNEDEFDQKPLPRREDRMIIKKDTRFKSKISERGNFHMIVDNSLRLLLTIFEKNKIVIKRKANLNRKLNGFIQPLNACFRSRSPKCIMRALKCLHFIASTKPDLTNFKKRCNSIMKRMFNLLSDYNGGGKVQGDNLEMIGICYKTLTTLLLKCKHIQLTDSQARALLTYIEENIDDDSRQSTTFKSLYSLVRKGVDTPELKDIFVKVADLAITSYDESVRSIAIKICQVYLLEYKHEKNALQAHLSKFLRQLDYEMLDGRQATLRILNIVVTKFPENLLRDYYELIFHLLAQRVVNEDSKQLRDSVAKLIGTIIQRLEKEQAYLFNKFVLPWASHDAVQVKVLGIKLTSIFIESCPSLFKNDHNKIDKILSIIADCSNRKSDNISPSANENCKDYDSAHENRNSNEFGSKENRIVNADDKLAYHSLRLMRRLIEKKLTEVCENRHIQSLKSIWQGITMTKLTHWHLPVLLTACELSSLFIQNSDVGECIKDPENFNRSTYISKNAIKIVRTLCDRYIDLLDRADESEILAARITQDMVLLGKMIVNSKATYEFEKAYLQSFKGGDFFDHMLNLDILPQTGFLQDHMPYDLVEAKRKLCLVWLAVKVVMQARKEVALYRVRKCHRRDFVLRWTAEISSELGRKRIKPYVILFTMTPIRELTDKLGAKKSAMVDDKSRQNIILQSEDLLKYTKELVGVDTFNNIYSMVQLYYTRRRVARKRKEAILRVKDQSRGVKRKLIKHRDKGAKRGCHGP